MDSVHDRSINRPVSLMFFPVYIHKTFINPNSFFLIGFNQGVIETFHRFLGINEESSIFDFLYPPLHVFPEHP